MTTQNFTFANIYLGGSTRRYRSLRKLVHPVVEPVSLAELKMQCRVDHDEEDDLLVGHIQAAREYAEQRTDRCFIDTRLEMQLDRFPSEVEVRLPRPPFSPTEGRQTIEVQYLDTSLTTQSVYEAAPNLTATGSQFLANRSATPAILTPNMSGYWPAVGPLRSAVTVRWWAGYGASGDKVPRGIRNAILALAAHWYLNREAVTTGSMARVPMMVDELLAIHSWGSYA